MKFVLKVKVIDENNAQRDQKYDSEGLITPEGMELVLYRINM